ncbi:MAG: hypothetical protein ATN32_05860 [Candidatus Epulonipiscium fishelsonii]|nr:MAG: hypothetical protein ATN32_05860 [Epulopiscium sp. AS2M-Bin002]
MKSIYLMVTRTNTAFCRALMKASKEPYPHVSLVLDEDFATGHSFSRLKIHNPLVGGLKHEEYTQWLTKFPSTVCKIYKMDITQNQYDKLNKVLDKWYSRGNVYGYNLRGVVGRKFNVNIHPKNRYFCSHFVSQILREADILYFDKPPICTLASDFMNHEKLELIYDGTLKDLLYDAQVVPNEQAKVKRRERVTNYILSALHYQ